MSATLTIRFDEELAKTLRRFEELRRAEQLDESAARMLLRNYV